jgi:signal transduction histidine kinase
VNLGWIVGAAVGAGLGAAVATVFARKSARKVLGDAAASADSRRQEEQAALVGTIAAGLAHEIRNPLSTLRMNLQLLREDWADPITEREQKGKKRIDVLLRETERLENVVSDFVRFASGHALKLEPTSLNQLAGELLDFLAPQAERVGVKLKRDFDPALPPVDVDPNLFRQAAVNLLVNALQAVQGGGSVEVRTRAEPGWATLAVQDDGPGIPPEHRDRIFSLYFSTKPGGTGLGLPMVKKIVEEHQGRVEVATEPGKGSTFTIWLRRRAS